MNKFPIYTLLSADKLCKQFGPISAPTECWFCSRSKVFDTMAQMVFIKKIERVNFDRNQQMATNA